MPANPDLLADAFGELPANVPQCPLGRIIADASPVAQDRIQTALKLDYVSLNWIVSQLSKAGRPIGKDSVAKHRNGTCRCAS